MYDPIPESIDALAREVVDAALAVHRELGPGLLESVYEVCLCYELSSRDVTFQCQVPLPITYRDFRIDAGLKLDVWVSQKLIVEIKSVERLMPVHEAQLLSYLKLTGNRVGLLINFNVPLLKQGIKRLVR